jgi:signal transduction histidine kinase
LTDKRRAGGTEKSVNINLKNRRMWKIALIIFGAYTAVLIVHLPSVYYFNAQKQQPTDLLTLTLTQVWGMYLWVFITPFILWAGSVFRVARPNLWRNVCIHLAVGVLIGLVRPMIEHFGLWMFGLSSWESLQTELFKTATYIRSVTGSIVTYPSVIGIQQAYLYFRESQERAFRLQQAELQVLKMQLHPHFFFNTLNALSALIYTSPRDADRMITQLSDLFRISLKKDKAHEISLKEELEFLKAYLQIHQTLMGKRLDVQWKIQPETLDALVPNLILQPLVENSIQHGISPMEAGGQIEIHAARSNGTLHLEVRDNGQGLRAAGKTKNNSGGGVGIANTRARLENLYNRLHRFEINSLPDGGGTVVHLEVPFHQTNPAKQI